MSTVRGRSLNGRASRAKTGAGLSTRVTPGGGLVWPLRGFRPGIPIEDWAPDSELGLAWGAQWRTDWDIVVLVRGSDGSLWAAEYGGYGSGFLTGSVEPDWTDTPPITDNDFTWYAVTGTRVTAWSAGMTIDGPTFIAAEGHVWVSYPGYTGTTGGSIPDFAGALPGDFVADNDTYWWPFPVAEQTIILDPAYGNAEVVALPGLDAFNATDDDPFAIATAITSDAGIRFDQDGACVFLTTDASGECVRVIRGDFGEGAEPDQTLGGLFDILGGGFTQTRLASGDDAASVVQRARYGAGEITGSPFLAWSGLPTVEPSIADLGASGAPAFAPWLDEANDLLMFTALYPDGTTVKSGGIPLA